MNYRQTAADLLTALTAWDQLLPGREKIRLIACGGTALTLLGYKESTKDVDFLVPELKEYEKLINFLDRAGYENVGGRKWKRKGEFLEYDLFPGKTVFMTELLRSPLEEEGHIKIREFNRLSLGVLNSFDLIVTKMARGTSVDFEDCLTLLKNEKLNWKKLRKHYEESAKYSINFGINEEKAMENFKHLEQEFKKERK